MRELMKDNASAVCLIKPQFEAGKENVGKKGVVRDKSVHESVVNDIVGFALNNGFSVHGLDFSPVKGPQGNIEYLVLLQKADETVNDSDVDIADLVNRSHETLDK